MRRTRFALILFYIFFTITTVTHAQSENNPNMVTAVTQAQSANSPIITAVHTNNFPDVAVDFQLNAAVDAPLDPTSYTLTEDGQAVEIQAISTVENRAPVSLLILIDQGLYSVSRYRQDYDERELKQLFYTLGDDFLQEGDQVQILTGRWDSETNGRLQIHPHLQQTSNLLVYTQAIDTLDLDLNANDISLSSVNPIETPELLEAAINQMTATNEPNGIILYLSALIHAPNEPGPNRALNAAERLSSAAQTANLQLIIFQAAANTISDDIRAPMQNLAYSEAHYVELLRNRDNIKEATAVYSTLSQTETSYTATYRSSNPTTDERTVTLAATSAPNQTAQFAYAVSPQPPILSDEVVTFTNNGRYQLNATLNWPDQMPREVATLQIDGQSTTSFTLNNDALEATFDSTAYNFVQATLTDELNISSNIQLSLPDVPITAVTPTPVTTAPKATPSTTFSWQTLFGQWLPWTALLLAIGYIIIFQRKQLPQLGQRVQHAARRFTTIIAGNPRQQTIAHLHIIAARDDLIDETVDLITDITTLGRDPQLSDIQLYAEEERSSISGQHCTIQFDQGHFHITDNGSANGTAVNNIPIPADNPHPLNNGDEIQLGHKARRGATLRFAIAEDIQRQQRATITEAAFPGSQSAGKATQTDLEGIALDTPIPNHLPVLNDDEWWKNLE